MGSGSLGVYLVSAASIAALHALIPSHWLAFAVVSRAQRWTMSRTLMVTAAAGTGHILLTTVLGIVIATLGKSALDRVPESVEHAAPSVALVLLGLWFIWPIGLKRGAGHLHVHLHLRPSDHSLCEHDDEAGHAHDLPSSDSSRPARSHAQATGALVLGMTLSPCIDMMPVFLAAASAPWTTLLAIGATLTIVTVGLMLLLVYLTHSGLSKLNLAWLERHEARAVGLVLIALGVSLLIM